MKQAPTLKAMMVLIAKKIFNSSTDMASMDGIGNHYAKRKKTDTENLHLIDPLRMKIQQKNLYGHKTYF